MDGPLQAPKPPGLRQAREEEEEGLDMADPTLGRSRDRLPVPLGMWGAVRWGGCAQHIQEGMFCLQPSFSQDFQDKSHRIPPTCCCAPQEGLGSPKALVLVPKWPQERGEALRDQWAHCGDAGCPMGHLGIHWVSRHPTGSLDNLWDQRAHTGLWNTPWGSWTPVGPYAVSGVSRHPIGLHIHPNSPHYP